MSQIEAAFILAAGRGERMRPLTDHTPKPLLQVGGRRLIEWHLLALREAGVRRVVINTAHLAECFEPALGGGDRYGLEIRYSHEAERLETGGGLLKALPLIGAEQFLLVNGDVYCDADYRRFALKPGEVAQLLMVDNPIQHPQGDFHLAGTRLQNEGEPRLTYAGIGLYSARILDDWREVIGEAEAAQQNPPRFGLAPLLRAAMAKGRVAGLFHDRRWVDVGTPDRLRALDAELGASAGA